MSFNKKEIKSFNVLLPKELWAFLKKESAYREVSMVEIIKSLVEKYKNKTEKKLTSLNTDV
jgi:hypothetical protein